jgi:hypothetical protein
VDHIVHLFGKNKAGEQVISGLHVPSNLRAIPKSLNRKRGDWFYVIDAESEVQGTSECFGFETDEDNYIPW